MAELEPGWLMRTAHSAHISCMQDHDPAAIEHIAKTERPVPESEARELYDRMNARFKKWTGKDLASMAQS